MRREVIGNAELWLGDCREVLPSLSGVDAVVTSPPYNQMASLMRDKPSGIWGKSDHGLSFVNNWKASGYEDDQPEDVYQTEQNSIFAMLTETCRETASLFYNHQCRWRDGVCLLPSIWFHPNGWRLRQEITWDRGGGMMFNARMFVRFDERILWFTRSQWKWNQEAVGDGTVWRIARAQNKEHPVAFPVELPWRCIRATTEPGDIVLDPYAGSGTSGVAAAMLGRKFIGIERREEYFDIACRRIEQAQRQKDLFVDVPAADPQEARIADLFAEVSD